MERGLGHLSVIRALLDNSTLKDGIELDTVDGAFRRTKRPDLMHGMGCLRRRLLGGIELTALFGIDNHLVLQVGAVQIDVTGGDVSFEYEALAFGAFREFRVMSAKGAVLLRKRYLNPRLMNPMNLIDWVTYDEIDREMDDFLYSIAKTGSEAAVRRRWATEWSAGTMGLVSKSRKRVQPS